jgi:hypothetical protein
MDMSKRIQLLFLVIASCCYATAQFVTIPDAKFRAALKSQFPTSFNTSDQLDTNHFKVLNTTVLDVSTLQISNLEGVQYFKNLSDLICYNNLLSSLPPLPKKLRYLTCHANSLTSLPELPLTLESLNCRHNNLAKLPQLPEGLLDLYCYNNLLTTLPVLPSSLSVLGCHNNSLKTLPNPLPSKLMYLNFEGNQIADLPPLSNTLTKLYCGKNLLKNLLALPSTLTVLGCSSNQLESLPTLPSALVYLKADDNCFTSVPQNPYPSTLATFTVIPNKINCTVITDFTDEKVSSIKVFPIPCHDRITIDIDKPKEVKILNAVGELVFYEDVKSSGTIDLNLQPGIYLVQLNNEQLKLIVE